MLRHYTTTRKDGVHIMKDKHLTTNQGVPVTDNQNSLTVGERGPVLLQDVHLIEKLAHFDRERIPERVVHAKGAGAHGYFQVYKSMAEVYLREIPSRPEEEDACLRPFLYRGWRTRICRYGPRSQGLCREVLHRRRKLRSGGEQSARLLHPGRHQVPGYGTFLQARP